jgi:hypothetical protein
MVTFISSIGAVRVGLLQMLIPACLLLAGTPYDQMDVSFYHSSDGVPTILPTACIVGEARPDSGRFDFMARLAQWPVFGYPMHGTMFVGINDTLQVSVEWFNHVGVPYDLKEVSYEKWYASSAYMLNAVPGVAPERGPDGLGFRVRGWYGSARRIEPVTVLPPNLDGWLSTTMDIWNLPVGRFQVCIEPTASVPQDFHANGGGFVYDYYPAQSLADSVNGYEACFWRATSDSDLTAAKEWADRILAINSASVPGWWLKAYNAWDRGDKDEARSAFDKAIDLLNKMSDPALPDSTRRPLMQVEKDYLEWLRVMLPYNCNQLGP